MKKTKEIYVKTVTYNTGFFWGININEEWQKAEIVGEKNELNLSGSSYRKLFLVKLQNGELKEFGEEEIYLKK